VTTSTIRALTPSTVSAVRTAITAAACPNDALLALRRGVHAALCPERRQSLDRRRPERTYRTDAYTIPDDQWRVLAETLIARLRALGTGEGDVAAAVEWWFRFGPRVNDVAA